MEKIYKEIVNSAFSLEMNCNDFFAWACAYSLNISSDDMTWIVPLMEKHPAGLNIALAYIANIEPIAPWVTTDFREGMKYLMEIKPFVYSDESFREEYEKEGPYRIIG